MIISKLSTNAFRFNMSFWRNWIFTLFKSAFFLATNNAFSGSINSFISNVGIGTTNPNSGGIFDARGVSFINLPSSYNYSTQGYSQALSIAGTGSGSWCQLYIFDTNVSGTNYVGLQIKADNTNSYCSINSGKQGTGSLPLILNSSAGTVGIGNTNPQGTLHIGTVASTYDGTLVISKNNSGTRNFKLGYDSSFNF